MESPKRSHPNQAQQLVLSLQELRQLIASLLSSKDHLACCQVSRQWHQDWSPFYWKDVIRRIPKDFSRYGHLIRNLDLRFDSYLADTLTGIRTHCLGLRSLKLVGRACTQLEFDVGVLGIHSAPLSSPIAPKAKQGTDEAVSQDPMNNPFHATLGRNGFLSNSLHSLNLAMPPKICDVILPRLTQARRAGLLQDLRSFCMGQMIIFYTCIEVEPTLPCTLKISTVLEFLDAFPELISFSTTDITIVDDTEADISKLMISPPSIDQAPSAQHCQAQARPNIVKLHVSPATPQGFKLLATKMPNVVDLALQPRGSGNLLPLILQYYPTLTSLALYMDYHNGAYDRVDESDLESLKDKYKDWIQLFQGLPNLEHLKSRLVGLPYVVLKTITQSCPKLKSFSAIEQTTSIRGVQYLLRHSTTLKVLILSENCDTSFFSDDGQPWKAPLETLHLEDVTLTEDQGQDTFRNRIRQLTRLRSLKVGYAGRMSIRSILDPDDCRLADAEKRPLPPKAGENAEGWKAIDGVTHSSNDDSTSRNNIASASTKDGDIGGLIDGDMAPVVHYPCLEELKLSYFPKVSTQGAYWRVVDTMPRLRSLKLDKKLNEDDILEMRKWVA